MQWLYDELVKDNHEVIMPTLPNADHPSRNECLNEIIKLLKDLNHKELVMIGHSLGVTSALDYIEECNKKVLGLISVSGFHLDTGHELNSYFMKEKDIDFEKVNTNLNNKAVIYGDNDPYLTKEIREALADELDVDPYIIENGGHLNESAGFSELPLITDILNSWEIN
ncbi:MAG: alpha/beta hydrolase [Candidatus Dojkabacteria bacterium]|nr:alpha/beta hydrolase [Candidatus Dojkabacteria bacterium]MDQ7021045.1 alpha/beta hydrolase [Candidatus Dojkabacteria bacterium]